MPPTAALATAAKTPHRRRRRLVANTPNETDKENHQPACNVADQDFGAFASVSCGDDDSDTVVIRALRLFNASQERTSSATTSALWKEHSGWSAECVVRASLLLSTSKKAASGVLYLEEHAHTLLSTSRKLIKEATECKEVLSKLDHLLVAVHTLRALAPILEESSAKLETCFRLLYHLIAAASDLWTKDGEYRGGLIALAGYEALGHVLTRYSSSVEDGRTVGFEHATNETGFGCFAIPSWSRGESSTGTTMTLRQVATIALKMTISTASIINQFWWRSVKTKRADHLRESTGMYGDLALYIITQQQQQQQKLDTKRNPHHLTIGLFRHIYLPWLSFLADSSDEESLKDFTPHCKSAHRTLWDAASKLKSAAKLYSTNQLEVYCLELRMHAILLLLPETEESSQYNQLLHESSHFESACSSAWKAASVYAQQVSLSSFPVPSDHPLAAFHTQLGAKLTRLQQPLETSSFPLSYVEYCSYRALHCRQGPLGAHTSCSENHCRLVDELPSSFEKHADADSLVGQVVIAAMLLGIDVRQNLEADSCQGFSFCDSCTDISEYLDRLIRQFDSNVIQQLPSLSSDTRNRLFKLLSMLSLHRTIFVTMKNQSWKERTDTRDLQIAATILTKCIGPYTRAMMTQEHTDATTKLSQLYDSTIECYIRPLSAFEKLSEHYQLTDPDASDYFLDLSNQVLQELCQILLCDDETIDPPPTACLEKCAKSISAIARQRTDRNMQQESLLPLLHSLTLYHKLSDYQGVVNNANPVDYQLSARLAHFASLLQHVGLVDEAGLALSLVLATEVPGCYCTENQDPSSWSEIDFLKFFSARSKQVLLPISSHSEPTYLAKSSIRRLVTLSMEASGRTQPSIESHTSPAEGMDLSSALGLIMESLEEGCSVSELIENRYGRQHQLGQLLGAIFQGLNRQGAPETSASQTSIPCVLLLVDVLLEYGAAIQRLAVQEQEEGISSHEYHLHEYETLVTQVNDAMQDFPFFPEILRSMLHLVASTSLLPHRTFYCDSTMYDTEAEKFVSDLSRKLARESYDILQSEVPNELIWVVAALKTSVFQFSCFLDGDLVQDRTMKPIAVDLVGNCRDLVDFQRSDASVEGMQQFSKHCILWTMAHLQNRLECGGDALRAGIVAQWTLDLIGEDMTDASCWFRAVSVNAFLHGGAPSQQIGLPHDENLDSFDVVGESGSLSWLSGNELLLSIIRVGLLRNDKTLSNSTYPNQRLEILQHEVEIKMSAADADTNLLLYWLLSTIELTLSEIAVSFGYFSEALKHIQRCSRLCQTVISRSRTEFRVSDSVPFWVNIARSTLFARVSQRYTESISRRSQLYCRIGDHRKAASYMASLADFLGIELILGDKGRIPNLESWLSSSASSTLAHRGFCRLNSEIRCFSSPFDVVARCLERYEPSTLSSTLIGVPEANRDISFQLEGIRDLLSVGDIIYGESVNSGFQSTFAEYYKEAIAWHSNHGRLIRFPGSIQKSVSCEEMSSLFPQIKLRHARCLMNSSNALEKDCAMRIQSLCDDVANSCWSRSVDKAWAHFYLGSFELHEARRLGELQTLWEGRHELPPQAGESLRNARDHFLQAASCHAIGSDIISRFILRGLALAVGPESGELSGLSAGILVLSSIGQSFRQFMVRSMDDDTGVSNSTSQEIQDAFGSFDGEFTDFAERDRRLTNFFDRFAELVPNNWKFVAPTICSSGEILVTSVEKSDLDGTFSISTTCVFPHGENGSAYDDTMKPLDEIIRKSQEQLQGMDQSAVSEQFSKESAKRKWWDDRHQLDMDLKNLLERVEAVYFPSLHLKGRTNDSIFSAEESSLPCGNLASKFEAAIDLPPENEADDAASFQKLTVPKLKERLRQLGIPNSETRKLRKQELVDFLTKEVQTRENESDVAQSITGKGCLFLILDENLHRFPFEGMPSLEGRAVCRVPSLPFVFATLVEHRAPQGQPPLVDPNRTSYVLDPENNLQATRSRIFPVLESISSSRSWNWDAVVGEIPPSSFFEKGLERENGLVLYFGHGGAQVCFSRRQVDRMVRREAAKKSPSPSRDVPEIRSCKATVILMGCSSGRLVSVNRKHSQSAEQIPLYYEPEGIALSYLCAGSPCVVGNLWDVTDHDIDRFSMTLMEKFFHQSTIEDDSESLVSCVAASRAACKLRYIVGCAPVCYGVPVHLCCSEIS